MGGEKMKIMKQIAIFCILSLITSACATMPMGTAEKYNLDGQLEPVSEITKYNLMGWETVDRQSFVLQTSPSQYYLIVLIRPSEHLVFSESIGISHTGDLVKPGYDRVTVYSSSNTDTYVIDKIFKLKDREEIKAIKAQLTGK